MKRLGIFALGIIALFGGIWFFTAHELESTLNRHIFNLNQRGHKVTVGGLKVSGFPTKMTVNADALRAEFHRPDGVICTLETKAISLKSTLWAPLTPVYKIDGLSLSHQKKSGEIVHFKAATADGTAHFDSQFEKLQGDMRTTDVRLEQASGIAASAREWKVELRDMGRDANTDQLTFSLVSSLKNLSLPPESPVTESAISMVYLDALVKGPFFPKSKVRLEEWAKQNGVMEVRTFTIKGEQLDAQATGELRLNSTLVPEGRLTVKTPTLDPVINLMSLYGTVSKGAATALKFVQGLGLSVSDTQKSRLTLQMIAKDGILTVGGIPLAKMKPIF